MCASDIHGENKNNCVVLNRKPVYPHILAPNAYGGKDVMSVF